MSSAPYVSSNNNDLHDYSNNDITNNLQTYFIAQVGTCDGHLYVFENGATVLTRSVKAHTGAVYTLHPVYPATPVAAAAAPASGSSFSDSGRQQDKDGSSGDASERGEVPIGFWSGGKDGLVKFFNGQVRVTAVGETCGGKQVVAF